MFEDISDKTVITKGDTIRNKKTGEIYEIFKPSLEGVLGFEISVNGKNSTHTGVKFVVKFADLITDYQKLVK